MSLTISTSASTSTSIPPGGFMNLLESLLKNYDKGERPLFGVSPLRVITQYRVNRLFNVDPAANSFSVGFLFTC
jgi:hypothetical protein